MIGDFAWKNHNKYVQRLNGKKNLIIGSHDHMSQLNYKQFSEVHNGFLLRKFKETYIFMSHCPMLTWERSHYGSINLHGHSHGRTKEYEDTKRMDVGIDVSPDYAPFSLDFILYKMSLKKPKEYSGSEEKNDTTKINRDYNINLFNCFTMSRSVPE